MVMRKKGRERGGGRSICTRLLFNTTASSLVSLSYWISAACMYMPYSESFDVVVVDSFVKYSLSVEVSTLCNVRRGRLW